MFYNPISNQETLPFSIVYQINFQIDQPNLRCADEGILFSSRETAEAHGKLLCASVIVKMDYTIKEVKLFNE